MKGALVVFLSCWAIGVFGQISIDKTSHNFGEVTRESNRVVDFRITNNGPEKAFLLRSDFEDELATLYSNRTINPGEQITLRVKITPRSKNAFKSKAQLYFSSQNEPINLTFRADVKYADNLGYPECPSFAQLPPGQEPTNGALFRVVDKMTGAELPKSKIRFVKGASVVEEGKTDKKGELNAELPIAWYLMVVDATGYLQLDSANYINRRNNLFIFEMEKDPAFAIAEEPLAEEIETVVEPEIVEPEVSEEPEEKEEEEVIVIAKEPVAKEVIAEKPAAKPKPAVERFPDMPLTQYVPNNIVFLVDVSASMKAEGRMDLLKVSMIKLVETLREVDNVSIVSYATQTKLILPPTNADKKQSIIDAIHTLQAGGQTSGAKGLERAYKTASDNFKKGGNNEIVIATDGVFRVSEKEKIAKQVQKIKRKKIVLSVVGIKARDYAAKSLGKMAKNAGGAYIKINRFEDSEKALIDEIRERSHR